MKCLVLFSLAILTAGLDLVDDGLPYAPSRQLKESSNKAPIEIFNNVYNTMGEGGHKNGLAGDVRGWGTPPCIRDGGWTEFTTWASVHEYCIREFGFDSQAWPPFGSNTECDCIYQNWFTSGNAGVADEVEDDPRTPRRRRTRRRARRRVRRRWRRRRTRRRTRRRRGVNAYFRRRSNPCEGEHLSNGKDWACIYMDCNIFECEDKACIFDDAGELCLRCPHIDDCQTYTGLSATIWSDMKTQLQLFTGGVCCDDYYTQTTLAEMVEAKEIRATVTDAVWQYAYHAKVDVSRKGNVQYDPAAANEYKYNPNAPGLTGIIPS